MTETVFDQTLMSTQFELKNYFFRAVRVVRAVCVDLQTDTNGTLTVANQTTMARRKS